MFVVVADLEKAFAALNENKFEKFLKQEEKIKTN